MPHTAANVKAILLRPDTPTTNKVLGINDLTLWIAATLKSDWNINNPYYRTLSTVRILGSIDETYGSVGWVPPLDGSPFCTIDVRQIDAKYPETNRIWSVWTISTFVGVVHADTPNALFDYQAQAAAWIDRATEVIPAHCRLAPYSAALQSTSGDVWWEFVRGTIREKHLIYESLYYGAEVISTLRYVKPVNYQP